MSDVQGLAKVSSPGLVNYVPAVVYHFCLSLSAAVTQPGDHLLAEICSGGAAVQTNINHSEEAEGGGGMTVRQRGHSI